MFSLIESRAEAARLLPLWGFRGTVNSFDHFMRKPINTCVLGVGLAGLTFHVPFILALPDIFTLHSVLERNPQSSGGKVHDRFNVTVKIHRTLDQVLEDSGVELVIVGTPSHTHYSIAKAALEAGKHGRHITLHPSSIFKISSVLVDKPVTATSKEAKELGQIARDNNLVLYAFQNRRWDADFLALRRLLSLPESSPQSLGNIVEFESQYVVRIVSYCLINQCRSFDRYRKDLKGTWKDEPLPAGGQTYDLGSHLIDQALTLFGRPEKLTAFLQNVRGVGDSKLDDCVSHYIVPCMSTHSYSSLPSSSIIQRGITVLILLPQSCARIFYPPVLPNFVSWSEALEGLSSNME